MANIAQLHRSALEETRSVVADVDLPNGPTRHPVTVGTSRPS